MSAKIILPKTPQIIGDSSGTNSLVFNVSSLSPVGYLNARYPSDITLVGGAISIWANRGSGGTGWDAKDNGFANHRPAYVSGGYATFDGVTNTLTSLGVLAFNQPSTVAIKVAIKTGVAVNATVTDGTTLNQRRIYSTASQTLNLFAGVGPITTGAGSYVLDQVVNIVGVYNGANCSLTTSLKATVTGNGGANAANGWNFSSIMIPMDLYAVAIFSGAMSAANISKLINAAVWL